MLFFIFSVKGTVRFVPHAENAVGVLFKKFVAVFRLPEVQIVPLHHVVAYALYFGIQPLRCAQLVFQPVHVLHVAALLDKPLIVRIVVLLLEGGKTVEALYQQSLPFQVGKAQRPRHLRHALLPCPAFHRVKQRAGDVKVVYAVETGKAHPLLSPLFVGGVLQYAGYSPRHFAVQIGVEIHRFRLIAVHIVAAENAFFVNVQRGYEIFAVFVQSERKT